MIVKDAVYNIRNDQQIHFALPRNEDMRMDGETMVVRGYRLHDLDHCLDFLGQVTPLPHQKI